MLRSLTIDQVNIGLILASAVLAILIPFELFLFAYAVLGPLHYLTEISWLHDKNYYAQNKRDVWILLIISLFITLLFFLSKYPLLGPDPLWSMEQLGTLNAQLLSIAFGCGLIIAFVKNKALKLVGVLLVGLLVVVAEYPVALLSIFLPTLLHVYLFTMLFMLYGAIKQKSRNGFISVILHIVCPILLFLVLPSLNYSSERGISMYTSSDFSALNKYIYGTWLMDTSQPGWTASKFFNAVFSSSQGIAIMRFIAYAYLYHYLNWFSKTEVIRWHKIPKERMLLILFFWGISITLYATDYTLGFQWLFLLSLMHVLLEFPLNFVSMAGILQVFRKPAQV